MLRKRHTSSKNNKMNPPVVIVVMMMMIYQPTSNELLPNAKQSRKHFNALSHHAVHST